jgi:hypothetical protein
MLCFGHKIIVSNTCDIVKRFFFKQTKLSAVFLSNRVLDIFTQHLQNLSGLEMKIFSKNRIRYRIFYEQNLNQFTKVYAFSKLNIFKVAHNLNFNWIELLEKFYSCIKLFLFFFFKTGVNCITIFKGLMSEKCEKFYKKRSESSRARVQNLDKQVVIWGTNRNNLVFYLPIRGGYPLDSRQILFPILNKWEIKRTDCRLATVESSQVSYINTPISSKWFNRCLWLYLCKDQTFAIALCRPLTLIVSHNDFVELLEWAPINRPILTCEIFRRKLVFGNQIIISFSESIAKFSHVLLTCFPCFP